MTVTQEEFQTRDQRYGSVGPLILDSHYANSLLPITVTASEDALQGIFRTVTRGRASS